MERGSIIIPTGIFSQAPIALAGSGNLARLFSAIKINTMVRGTMIISTVRERSLGPITINSKAGLKEIRCPDLGKLLMSMEISLSGISRKI